MSVLSVQLARMEDPDLQTFDSGVEEVNRYFSEGRWFDRKKGLPTLPTYRFALAAGDCVGFASGALRTVEFPEGSGLRGKFPVVSAGGVVKGLIGEKVPGSANSYAFHIV